eukprot:Partr_v1_DN26889_c0_g1_i1_m40953 putative transporter
MSLANIERSGSRSPLVKKDVKVQALLRKFDRRILPLVTLLYLCAFLPRVNIANIRVEISRDLHISNSQFGLLLVAFFVGYALLEVPANLCLKKFSAGRWFPLICMVWGLTSCLSALSTSFAWIFTFRLAIGSIEAGIFPGILYLMSFWYLKSERGLRFSVVFVSSLVSSSLASLFAYALLQLDGRWGLRGWQWVTIVEALPSLILAVIIYYWLPDSPAQASWLSDEEKDFASSRLEEAEKFQHRDIEESVDFDEPEPIRQLHRVENKMLAFKSPIVWLFSLLYLLVSMPMAAVTLFLPTIVGMFGFTSVMANLVTAPIYLIASISVLLLSRNSDKKHERPLHMLVSAICGIAGFGGLAFLNTDNSWQTVTLSLICTQLAVNGASGLVPLTCVWLTGVIPHDQPSFLAVASGTMVTFGQLAGFATPYIYTALGTVHSNDHQDYRKAHAVMAIVLMVIFLLILILRAFIKSRGGQVRLSRHQETREDIETAPLLEE